MSAFDWTTEVEEQILQLHSEGMALLDICSKPGMPTRAELSAYERKTMAFHKQMQIAREQFQQIVFEECIQIADDATGDYRRRVGRNGQEKEAELDIGSIQRSKVRIDTRLKVLKTIDPVKYGGRVAAGSGAPQAPTGAAGSAPRDISDMELGRRTAFVLEKARRATVAPKPNGMHRQAPSVALGSVEDLL